MTAPIISNKIQSPWIKDLQAQHNKFKFSNKVPDTKIMDESKDVKPLYQDEKDVISQLITKIVYAEGDHIDVSQKSVKFLKSQLKKIVSKFEDKSELKYGKKINKNGYEKKRVLKYKSKQDDSSDALPSEEEVLSSDNPD